MISVNDGEKLIVGYKQVLKAIKAQSCKRIFIAEDCSQNLSDNLMSLCKGTEIITFPTMRELGNECGIDVPASCAAIIRL